MWIEKRGGKNSRRDSIKQKGRGYMTRCTHHREKKKKKKKKNTLLRGGGMSSTRGKKRGTLD